MRTLYYVPMLHTPQELGSVAEQVIAVREKVYGKQQAQAFISEIERYWKEVARRIQRAGLYVSETTQKLHIFVDGLPDVEDSLMQKIVAELIEKGIPAYRIIAGLTQRGAQLYGTEDPDLLLREREIWIGVAAGKRADQQELSVLLAARDRVVACRIDRVVPDGKIGLLFIGKAHNVAQELTKRSRTFRIIYL